VTPNPSSQIPTPKDHRQPTILVPMDTTPIGEAKIPVVETYARALDAQVVLLHVLPARAVDVETVQPAEAIARTYLETVAGRLRGAGVPAETVLRTGSAAATIIQEALVQNVDLIVLGTNIRASLPSAVLGNVADQVARAAPCPVLLVRPEGHPASRRRLRSFHEDAERTGLLVQRHLGTRTIEVGRIIGSVERANELGPDFRPPARRRRKHDEDRFVRVRQALEAGVSLPPIDVYRLGFGYYVLDGHRRVAGALVTGQLEIDANVVEFVPAGDEQATAVFAARRAFELETGLTEVGAARPETYPALLRQIEQYRSEHQFADLRTAARRWYAEVFRPRWRGIRAQSLETIPPGDRTADVIAREG
jgi:nucleotide-binding universal stress UspA family protein